jgi:DNA-binding MarR family transcriptional regulator
MSSNALRLIGQEGARVRDRPRLSGVSKEAIAMSLGRLEERGLAFVQPESAGSRVKILRLTPKGRIAQDAYHRLILDVEPRWQARFGKDVVRNLRESLERLDGDATAHHSPLFRGLEPYPNGWRAAAPRPEGLPHYPMVLHRGRLPGRQLNTTHCAKAKLASIALEPATKMNRGPPARCKSLRGGHLYSSPVKNCAILRNFA